MEVDEGGGGYGFARRDGQARKKVGRRTAVHSNASVVPDSYAAPSEQPFWVWLLIGFLLGTGGTLLTVSFWLPESGNDNIAALETGDRPSPRSDKAAARTVAEPPLPDEATSEPPSNSTSVAALDIEGPAATPPVDKVLSDTDDVSETLSDLTQEIDAPDIETSEARNEAQPPTVAIDTDIAGERPVDDDGSTKPSDSEEALKALVSETALPETSKLLSLPDDRSRSSESDQPDRSEPTPSQRESPTLTEAPDDLPVAALSEDEPLQDAVPQAEAAEIEPPNEAARSELPPRIRQALQAAEAESQSAVGTEARNNSRLYRVQLAAVNDEAAARVFWREVNERLPGVFADVEPIFNQRLVDERLFLRVWVGAFENRLDADGYCGWLKLKGQDCFVTRVDNL